MSEKSPRSAGFGLLCPKCQSPKLFVSDSRSVNGYVRRRRTCEDCKTRSTTYEVIDNNYSTAAIKIGDAIVLRDQLMSLDPDTRVLMRRLLARLSREPQATIAIIPEEPPSS